MPCSVVVVACFCCFFFLAFVESFFSVLDFLSSVFVFVCFNQ